jgi:hypothetical protein
MVQTFYTQGKLSHIGIRGESDPHKHRSGERRPGVFLREWVGLRSPEMPMLMTKVSGRRRCSATEACHAHTNHTRT